jgi:SHAQKYF class myb-like DNA-binding protein
MNVGRWNSDEHDLFLEGLRIYGKNWDNICSHVKTRDSIHCRAHGQKFFAKLIKFLDTGKHKDVMPPNEEA